MPHPITIALYCLFLATFVLALQKLVHAIAHRYHLEFSVGLFSITGLRYSHHVPDPHDSASRRLKFCLSIGKFKIRFRRPTPDPTNNNDDDDPDRASCVRWVTVQVHDVSLVIPHLDIFLAPARKKHAHQHSELGRRLSAATKGMRIPWWYSLSMVKWLIKTVYAVPAQFLISGLANYVDLQLVGLSVVLEEVAVVRLERVRIGLTLFADVELAGWKRIRRKSGGRVNEQQEQQQQSQYNRSDSKQDPSSATATQSSPPDETATKNAHHQPHSMTDPQHLFTDKFAEIGLVFDGLAVTDARSARIGQDVADGQVVAALALPSGTNVAISCHLNAACVTLKDIEIDVKIGEVAVGIDGALRMARAVERIRGEVGTRSAEGSRGRVEEYGTRNRQPASVPRVSSSTVLSLLRSISLRIPKITVQYQFMEPSHSHMSLDSASSSSSTVALVFNSLETHIHLYGHEHPTSSSPAPASPSPSFPHRLDFSIATTHLDLTPALTKTDPLRLAQIDKISAATRVSAPVLPVPVSCSAHHVSGDYAELADETRLNDPNSRIVDIKIVVDRPRVVVDARRIEDLAGVVREMTRIRSAHEIAREDAQKHHLSWEDAMHPLRTPTPRFRNLPKLVGIVSILTPSLQFANTHTPSPTTISLGTADIVLELAGAYNALDDSTSFLSQPPTPTPAPIPRQHPPPITRRKSSTWAARLLRRHEEEPALAVWCERWMYNTTVGLKIREVVLEVRGKTGTEGKDDRYVAPEHRVVHFKQFVISVRGAAEVGLSKVEEGQDGAAEQQTVRQHQHQHPNHRHQPSITFGEPFFNSSPRLAEATAPRETIIDGESVRCDVAAAMEGLTLDLWAGKGEAANVLVMGGVKPLMSLVPEKSGRSTTKDPDATNAPLLALSALNSTFTIADLRLILPGTDRHNGAGTPAPEGYIDNAPRGTDITAGIIVELDRLSITYRGESAVAPRAGSPAVAVTPGGPEAYVPLPIVQETEEDPFLDLLMVRPLRTGCRRGGRIRVVVRRLRIQAFMVGAEGSMNVDGDVVLRVPEVSWKMEMLTEVEGQKKRVVWTTGVRIERVDAWYKVGHYYCAVLAAVGVMSLMELVAGKKGEARAAKDQKVAFDVSAVVEQLNFKATLPEKVNLFLRFDDMMVAHVIPTEPGSRDGEDDDDNNLVRIKRARFYGVANADESRWDELIGIDDFKLKLETDKILQETDVKQATSIILRVPALHFRVPFGYVYANVIDNAVNVFKITKHLNQRLIDGEPFNCEIPVRNDDPIRLPNINLDVNVLTLKIEDDPFEGRLSVIWKLGMTEQRRRLDREAAFQAKVNVLNGAEPSGDALKATVLGAPQGRSPAVVTSPFKPPPSPHANISVDTAQERLKEYNSRIWIKKVQASDAQRRRIFHQPNRHNRVPSEHYADEYSDPAFIISTVPPPLFPPLVKAVFCNIHLAVSGPSFPLEQVRPFMHDIGGGVPLDMPFSTLIPFRLNWKSGETWCQLRDYPLPLLYIPLMAPSAAAADGLPNVSTSPSWTLDGDFVFADELGDQEATRHVECLILEPSETVKVKYAMTVPRTASPPKFYSVVKADVHTPDPTRASWAISMQPAILEIALVFDTFTRPPVDPSPKVGFWDKIRLMIHTRSTINFVGNGDVSLVIKGTRDPYELKSRGAGLAKMWKRGVQIRIGHENPDGEFLQVESEQYVFGVPDLEAGGYVIKKIMPDHAGAPLRSTQGSSPASSSATTAVTEPKSYVSGAEQLQRQPPQLRLSQPTSNGDSKPKRSATVGSGSSSFSKDPAFLKVVLKLAGGIRFGLGCHFERQCKPGCQKCRGTEGKCRSLKFEPHYKVKYKNPEYVKVEEGKIYDAYEGFRSDFVHGSLSVVCPINSDVDSKSITPDSLPYNSMHLSPAFLSHFLQWWRLFGGEMSLPIKLGDLFPKEDLRVNQKLGKHLNTLKFKIKLDPLFLGYFNKEDGQEDGLIDGGGDSVGLKATVSQFSVDLHQHRELLVIEKKNLGPGLKPNWAMNEGEILLKNLDLRGVHVQYSTAGEENSNLALQRFMDDADSFQSGIFMFEPEAFMEGLDVNDPEWVDFDDYVELNTTTPDLKPKIQVLPIMYSPQMGYRKQLNRDDVEEYRYLAGTHACNMGRSKGISVFDV
ncbi:hypothetical protein BC936DRAFT_136619 [Jimgerdemannia flammicorona]|uniref:Golgi-body localization protein domain-containing protein n=1 Tax=Jimgerdemannia flammicorona TaxID=994334 RepID=A0A433CZ54_9FUNG|nr:hypothetical protein BC936DRAFT_136619 [Jimgerdemannia flammicorona]